MPITNLTKSESLATFGFSYRTVTSIATYGYLFDDEFITEKYYNPVCTLLGIINNLFPYDPVLVSNFHTLLHNKYKHLDVIDKLINDQLAEQFPDTATDEGLQKFWEQLTGISDFGLTPLPNNLIERRQMVIARLISMGRFNRQAFVDICTSLGYTVINSMPLISNPKDIWLYEGYYRAFRASISKCGDPVFSASDSVQSKTVRVIGVDSFLDDRLKYLFEKIKCLGVNFKYEEPV